MGWIQCRSDPILVLADGRNIKVIAQIDAEAASVTMMKVVVHGPPDTVLERVLYVGPDRHPESVEYHTDGEADRFRTVVTIDSTEDASVTIEAQYRQERERGRGRTNEPIEVWLPAS